MVLKKLPDHFKNPKDNVTDLHEVDPGAGQLNLGRILPFHREKTNCKYFVTLHISKNTQKSKSPLTGLQMEKKYVFRNPRDAI